MDRESSSLSSSSKFRLLITSTVSGFFSRDGRDRFWREKYFPFFQDGSRSEYAEHERNGSECRQQVTRTFDVSTRDRRVTLHFISASRQKQNICSERITLYSVVFSLIVFLAARVAEPPDLLARGITPPSSESLTIYQED